LSISIIFILILGATPGSEYLLLDSGPGIAFTGILGRGPSLIFQNPASIDAAGVDLFHTEWFQAIRFDNVSYATRLGGSHIGLGLNGVYTFGLEKRTRPTEEPEGKYGLYFITPTGGIQFPVDPFSFGVAVKLLYERIDEYKGYGGSIDLGARVEPGRFIVAIALNNLGLGPKLKDERSPLPLTIRGGIGYRPIDPIILSIELSKVVKFYEPDLRLGLSLSPFRFLSFKIGYYQHRLILGTTIIPGLIGIAYNYRPLALGSCHSIGVEYRPRPKRKISGFLARAIIYYQRGNWDKAINALDIALVLNPEDKKAQILLNKALEKKRMAIVDSLNRLGNQALGEGNYLSAISIFSQALSIDPENRLAKENRAQALSLFTAEVKMKSEVEAKVKQAITYYGQHNYTEALRLIEAALSLDPKNSEVIRYKNEIIQAQRRWTDELIARAENYLKAGKAARAMRTIEVGLKSDPNSQELNRYHKELKARIKGMETGLLREALTYYQRGKREQATKKFWQVLSLNPDNKTAKLYLSRLEQKGDPEKFYLLGVDAYTKGKFELAIQYWRKVLEIKPDHKWARTNIERAQKKLEALTQ